MTLKMTMHKIIKKIFVVALCAVLFLALCACDFDESKNNFYGGELVDQEKLSELKASIITESTQTVETEKEESTQDKESVIVQETQAVETKKEEITQDKENINDNTSTEIISTIDESGKEENQSENPSETAQEEDKESVWDSENEESLESPTEAIDQEEVVYWVEGGKVWHLSTDCRYLKDKENIHCGTVEEAMEAKKTKLCSSCEK